MHLTLLGPLILAKKKSVDFAYIFLHSYMLPLLLLVSFTKSCTQFCSIFLIIILVRKAHIQMACAKCTLFAFCEFVEYLQNNLALNETISSFLTGQWCD